MKKTIFRNSGLPVLLAAAFITLDLLLDRYFGGFGRFDWPHLFLAVSVLLVSFFLMNRAVDAARRAEAVQRKMREELKSRVDERTTQLEEANRVLQAEIDERSRIEQALRLARNLAESEKRHLEAVFQALPVGVVITDAQGGIVMTNGMDEQIWGPRPATRGVGDYVRYRAWWADSGKPVEPHEWASAQATERGIAVHGQVLEIERFDGSRGFILNSAVPVRDGEGRVIGSAVAIQDITGWRVAEQDQRTSAATARALMNALPESALLLDREGNILAANETAAQRLVTPLERLVGSSLFSYFAPDVGARRMGYLHRILQTRQPLQFVDERDGRSYDTHVNPVLDAAGNVTSLATFSQDITDRQAADERIQRLSSFPQLNPNPVLEVDASGCITFHNPAVTTALERLGLADDARAFLPDDMAAILHELEHQGGTELQREVHLGSAIFVANIHVISEFNVVRIYCFDVTKRVRAEEALRASEEKYRLLFQNMAEGFAIYELIYDEQGNPADWRILEVNDAYQRHTGIAREQIVGRRISELFPAAIPEYLPRFAAVVAAQTPSEIEAYAQAVGRYQSVSTFPAGGLRFASIIEDITQRKKSEEALLQAQAELALDAQRRSALEERQRLARELHDSVSQALYGISLGVHTALAQFDTDRVKVHEALEYALSLTHAGLMEMRALIFELRPESLEREGLVAALTKQTEALHARHGIEVELSLCDEPDVPLATKEELYRIAQEALQNAARHAHTDRLEVRLTREPDALRLEIRDHGLGFDPLAAYPGHLGLHSMRERATRVGGTLDIHSVPGAGTEIRARVPIPA